MVVKYNVKIKCVIFSRNKIDEHALTWEMFNVTVALYSTIPLQIILAPETFLLFISCVSIQLHRISLQVVFKLANHWLYHKQMKKKELSESTEMLENSEYLSWCSSTMLECSLFKPRNDDSYNLMILREEIKARKNK